jgi:hypothetical protein
MKDNEGVWWAHAPNSGFIGNLSAHNIEEHDDGTITVEPSILMTQGDTQYHGYLKAGEWTE